MKSSGSEWGYPYGNIARSSLPCWRRTSASCWWVKPARARRRRSRSGASSSPRSWVSKRASSEMAWRNMWKQANSFLTRSWVEPTAVMLLVLVAVQSSSRKTKRILTVWMSFWQKLERRAANALRMVIAPTRTSAVDTINTLTGWPDFHRHCFLFLSLTETGILNENGIYCFSKNNTLKNILVLNHVFGILSTSDGES